MILSYLFKRALARLNLFLLVVTRVDFNQADKQAHFLLGGLVSAVCLLLVDRASPAAYWHLRLLMGGGASVVVGALKEFADYYDRAHHTPDVKDFIATALGGLVIAGTLCWPW